MAHQRDLMEGEMSPDELDQSLPLRRDNQHRTQAEQSRHHDTHGTEDEEIQSSAPRTYDRMIKGNVPTYSPLTVSRKKNETTDGGDN